MIMMSQENSLELTIEFPDAYDVESVVIHSEDFNMDEKQKNALVNNIINVLENDINYYGVE